MKCYPWSLKHFKSGATAFVSSCGRDVELQARPDDWTRPNGATSYIVKYKGRIVRHGYAKTMKTARQQARRQAGSTGGLP